MAKPTYLVVIPIDPQQSKTIRKNKMKILHETQTCSLKQINMGTIKIFVTPLYKGIVDRRWVLT
jgi:hypothetical protein